MFLDFYAKHYEKMFYGIYVMSVLNELSKLNWKRPECYSSIEFSPKVKKWLLSPGSFTKRMALLSSETDSMHIKVLRENYELAKTFTPELAYFDCRYIFIREINIYLGSDLMMYARSVLPFNVLPIYKRNFRGLAQSPLGHLLFSSKEIKRSKFNIAKITPAYPEYWLAVRGNEVLPSFLWGRRSLFVTDQPLILLTEIFSPDLIRRIENEKSS